MAKAFLAETLADGQPQHVKTLVTKAEALGISERTLQRASVAMNVQKAAVFDARHIFDGWVWSLPGGKATRRKPGPKSLAR